MQTALILLTIAVGALGVVFGTRYRRLARRFQELQSLVRDRAARAERTERRLYTELIRQKLASEGRSPQLPIKLLSQFGEDAFLWDLFDGQTGGFFIEVGAYDGLLISTTYALEAAGWTGLLVEPQPDRFRACVANRPHSRVVHAAVSSRGSSGTTTFQRLECAAGLHSDLASSITLLGHQRSLAAEQNAAVATIEVPLTTLATLLRTYSPPPRIDVVVVDVEGFEHQVLDGLEIETFRPRVLLVEDHTRGKDERTADLIRRAGFREFPMLGHNRVWIDEREPLLIARALSLGLAEGSVD